MIDTKTNHVVADIPVGTRPGPVTSGAGSIWVGNLDDPSVWRIDADRRVVLQHIGGDRTPTGPAFGFRFVWVAHGGTGELSRIDPQFDKTSDAVDVADTAFGSQNGSVAVDARSVWAVFGDSTLARIEPTSRSVAESGRAGQNPAGIAVDETGIVWVSNAGDARVTCYSPAAFTVRPLGEKPKAVVT